MTRLQASKPVSEINPADYEVVYMPGGETPQTQHNNMSVQHMPAAQQACLPLQAQQTDAADGSM